MVKTFLGKLKVQNKDFMLFLLAGVFLGIAQSVDGSTFNNFLKDKFDMLIMQRSAMELPRELPGFLVFIIIGLLFALGDVRIAVVANILAAAGMFLLGIVPPIYAVALVCIFIYSSGMHVYMPLSNTIAMSFANDDKIGRKLGQVSAANTAALVVSSAILFLLFKFIKINYTVTFTIGAVAFLIAALLLWKMNPKQTAVLKTRFLFRKEYKLFYWLSILFGGRKQIFITFGPWVLVDIFKFKVANMTILFFIIATLAIVVRPLIGHLIDHIGERFVLCGEAAILFFVCLGYSFATDILPERIAVILICACYIIDQLLSAASMARSTYIRKIAVKEEDVSPTLSLGISIDHIMSMSLPFLGGYIWYNGGSEGYKYVFIGGAIIAVMSLISASFIKINKSNVEVTTI